MDCIHPLGRIPTPNTLRRKAEQYRNLRIRQSINEIVPDTKVSLMVDGWTTNGSTHNLWGIILQFIDKNWKLRRIPLAFIPHNSASDRQTMARLTSRVIEGYQLEGRVIVITADNAKNFNASDVSINIRQPQSITQFPCLAHSLQLVDGAFWEAFGVKPAEMRAELHGIVSDYDEDELNRIQDDQTMKYLIFKVSFNM